MIIWQFKIQLLLGYNC